jgi:tetratricopeptide (TPR) repeat protein
MALGHAAACALVLITASTSDAVRDYHRYWASALRDSGQPERALPLYERAVSLDPDFAQGHTGLGNLYQRLGRPQDALAQFEIARQLDPDSWRAHAGEAIAADALGDRDRARAAARRTLELNPNQRDARRILNTR